MEFLTHGDIEQTAGWTASSSRMGKNDNRSSVYIFREGEAVLLRLRLHGLL